MGVVLVFCGSGIPNWGFWGQNPEIPENPDFGVLGGPNPGGPDTPQNRVPPYQRLINSQKCPKGSVFTGLWSIFLVDLVYGHFLGVFSGPGFWPPGPPKTRILGSCPEIRNLGFFPLPDKENPKSSIFGVRTPIFGVLTLRTRTWTSRTRTCPLGMSDLDLQVEIWTPTLRSGCRPGNAKPQLGIPKTPKWGPDPNFRI